MYIENEAHLKMDILLDVLVLYTKLYHKPFSAESLVSGLPLHPDEDIPRLIPLSSSKELFSRASARAGLNSSLIKRSLKQISPLQLPMILILSNNEACILDSFNEDKTQAKIYMSTEEPLEQWVDIEQLTSEYLGFAFMIKKKYLDTDENSKTLKLKQANWFWSTIKLSAPIYKDVLIASFLINLFVLASPLFTMNVYDRVIPNNAIETLWVFAIGIGIIYIVDIVLKYMRSYLLEIAAKKSDIIMSSVIFEKVLDLKLAHHPPSVGSFASNLKDFDSIRSFLTNASMTTLIDLPFTVIFIAVIWYIGGPIVFIPIVTMILIILYSVFLIKPLKESIQSTNEANAKKSGLLIEALSNIETLKTLGSLGRVQWQWEEATGEIAEKSLKSRLLSASIPNVTQFFIQINSVMVVIFGVYLIQEFELTMGGLIGIVILTGRTLAPMGQVASLITSFENTKSSYNTINEIISQTAERPVGKKFVTHQDIKGKVEFKNVSFSYPNSEYPALSDVSFTIEPGENVAIIGRIGSGKSTIARLLLGLYEPTEGSILVDDIDINQIDPAELRKKISYVAQDVDLFRGTVRDNITYRVNNIDDDKMIRAAKLSCADEFINRHPMGYDMPVGEKGKGLSGGQRQSIGLARAVLSDTPFLIIDDPTSAMDQVSENTILENIHDNVNIATAIMITQRMTLLKISNRVIVMHNGKIRLDGPKEEVLSKLQGGK